MHGLFDRLDQPEIWMRLDLIGKYDSEVVEGVYGDLDGQACQTTNNAIHQEEVFLEMLSKE